MIVAAFISDRADLYIDDCLASFQDHVDLDLISAHEVFDDRDHLLGMAGNARAAWDWALQMDADYLLHIEEDFRFTDYVPLHQMRGVLRANPHIAQVVLKRHPWSQAEVEAGGQIETNPLAYTERHIKSLRWVEHSTLFSLNPCLIPRRTLELGWPTGGLGVERDITDACIRAGMRFAYYGRIEDEPRCEHVGYQRSAGHRW